MARGFSKAIICGNITRDPELRNTPNGASVCSFSVAVNRSFRDASGTNKEDVSFIDCSAWGKAGEIIAQYARKGTGILVSGRLDQRSWENNNGEKRSRVEVVVEDFNFLGNTNRESGASGGYGASSSYGAAGGYGASSGYGAGASGYSAPASPSWSASSEPAATSWDAQQAGAASATPGAAGAEFTPDSIPDEQVDVSEIPF